MGDSDKNTRSTQRKSGMKLSLALLSILQKPSAGADDVEGSTYEGSEDTVTLETCLTLYVPNSMLGTTATVNDMCSKIQTVYGTNSAGVGLTADFEANSCFATCTGDGQAGNTVGDEFDTNSAVDNLLGLGYVTTDWGCTSCAPATHSCMDYCVTLSGTADAFYNINSEFGAATAFSTADYDKFHASIENQASSWLTADLSASRSDDTILVTTARADLEVINEASGAGETTTPVAVTTTASVDGTTGVPDTTGAPVTTLSTTAMFGFKGCVTLYFPILWIVQTMFPGLFDFCPIFGQNFCQPFQAVGAPCWMNHCDAECRGDGKPDINNPIDADDQSAEQSDNTGECFKPGSGEVSENAEADKSKFGCFDFCFEVHMSQAHMDSLQTARHFTRNFSFNEADIIAIAEEIADDAMVDTVIQGPNVDTTNLAETNPGYSCVDETQTDATQCLLSDTSDAGFLIPDASDPASIVGETMWGAESETALTGIECANNNGGCSHTCSGEGLNGACSCPNQCWQLDTDQKTCNIHPDMVQLTCHPDRMEAHLAKCVVAGTDAYQLGNSVCTSDTTVTGDVASANPSNAAIISHDSCTFPAMGVDGDVNGDGVNDNGCLTFVVGLDECSMQVNADYENNKLTFMQELISTDFGATYQTNDLGDTGTNALVNFDPRVSVDFTCEYTADYVTDSAEVTTNPDEVTNNLQSTGVFGYALKTVQPAIEDFNSLANTWTDVHSTADGRDYMVGSTLYFQICDQQELSNVYFSVPECTVYNDNMTESYQIITDHCPDQFVNTQRVGRYYDNTFMTWNSESDQAGFISMPTGSSLAATDLATNQCLTFSYTVFEFVSNADESADLKLSCKVKACEYSENNPDNMAACTDNTCAAPGGRKRRSLTSEKYTTVTQSFRVARPQE